MKERLQKLLTIKSIVTIITTVVFSYLALSGQIAPEQFMLIFTTIIAFYFGTQVDKNNKVE